ncbi:MAG: helix-turn-helix transcriptional regulator [Mesorhizobium sp.]|uniref:helix-turn-helix domain-containing protein n=1 Tax=Mesorhizobium sp. TaxID=1871066 RepID=UPI0011F87D0D|nr:helix-turn-helix transcriptional regulator [Mesorhizobium sp.]TIP70340.1 MAG: helix-turn-helix transcriptional regulator [Mesorhizobium sp.]TIQ06737.1 MAG: helix-turn-helix transcriptional regulator [Mesorhizobium sp.]TIR48622.1 MAG: helix-turn-helix transcriptional regulator [Mesorhizobium sp.]TJV94689.1 MAG: helix-turn-helix transcriptional regulator [Mesorhizobium sp.]
MSYELKIDPKSRAAGRFIGQVRKELVSAAIAEKKETGVNQQQIATKLGVNRSVISRLLRGDANLTLRSIAEIAWAFGWEPKFTLQRKPKIAEGQNHFELPLPQQTIVATGSSGNNALSNAIAPVGVATINRKEVTYAG